MRITRIVFDADLRSQFDGLRLAAKELGTTLGPESRVIFVNRKRNSFKLLSGNQYLIYYRSPKGRIPLEALRYLPQQFGGSELEVTEAISKSFKGKFSWEWA
jgi:hypothetical protein